jgi:hypothetical protein
LIIFAKHNIPSPSESWGRDFLSCMAGVASTRV